MSICKEVLHRQQDENLGECAYQSKVKKTGGVLELKRLLSEEDSKCFDFCPSKLKQVSSIDVLRSEPHLERSTKSTDPLHIYLRQIGRTPLLTREQEIEYGRQVQQMMSLLEAKNTLAKKLRCEPTEQEWASDVHKSEIQLKQALHQGQQAKHKMVLANLRLVVAIAKKYQHRGIELPDLIQEGNLGLQRGVEKFDPTQGYRFSSYAHWWIAQGITRAISQQSRTIRLPSYVTENLSKIRKVQRVLSQTLGRTPTIYEIAAELKMPPKRLRQYLEWAQLPVSWNLRLKDDEGTELGELLKENTATPEESLIRSELSSDLEHLMSELTPQQREVLALRFGLVDGQALTLVKIGDRLNLGRERVRQIEKAALGRLRQKERSQLLLAAYD